MKFLIVFMFAMCAFVHGCIHCNPDWKPVPSCYQCPEKGWFGECLSAHSRTCNVADAIVDNTKDCGKGTWACIPNCCKN